MPLHTDLLTTVFFIFSTVTIIFTITSPGHWDTLSRTGATADFIYAACSHICWWYTVSKEPQNRSVQSCCSCTAWKCNTCTSVAWHTGQILCQLHSLEAMPTNATWQCTWEPWPCQSFKAPWYAQFWLLFYLARLGWLASLPLDHIYLLDMKWACRYCHLTPLHQRPDELIPMKLSLAFVPSQASITASIASMSCKAWISPNSWLYKVILH